MNIKRIFKSQKLRHKIMRLGKFLPDSVMISLQYRILLGRWPRLKNPKRFTEWIQWYKMHYRDPKMLKCVDKYEVREYVKEKGCGKYLNELYQVCNTAEEIEFDKLPQKFVIKTTSGGNGDNVLVIKDKGLLNKEETKKLVNSWLHKNYSDTSREWAYSAAARKPRIIVERYLENENSLLQNDSNHDKRNYEAISSELLDYKFYCFNGHPVLCQLISGRYSEEHIDFYDLDWNRLENVVGLNPNATNSQRKHTRPLNFNSMVECAEKLSEDFPYTRVDLYNINGDIYFGELTFYPGSGYGSFKPDLFDTELGQKFEHIKNKKWTKYIRAGK